MFLSEVSVIFRNPMALIRTGPVMAKFQQKCEDLLKLDKMVPSQQYNEDRILFVSLIQKRFQMKRFCNIFGTVTKVSKEYGFHGNLVTKYSNRFIFFQGYCCILLLAEN